MNSRPTKLTEEGFVADEIEDVVGVVRHRYERHLAEVLALNKLLTRSQYELTIQPESPRELTCAALFVRAVGHCQAVLILLERGMAPSARAMLRCALEGLFNLAACASDSKVALSFIDADPVDRKRRAKYLGQVQDPAARSRLENDELEAIFQQLQIKIDEVDAHALKARDMARRAGLEDMYLTAYAMLSGAVHSSAGDVDGHYRTDKSGRVLELITAPAVDDLGCLYLVLGETMVGLIRAMTKVFALSAAEQCEEHVSNLHKLHPDVAG